MRSLIVIALALAVPLKASAAQAFFLGNQSDVNFECTEGQVLTNQVVATFQDTFSNPGPFTVTIDWGDGTPLDTTTGVVAPQPSPTFFQVTGSHTYADEGSYPVTVTIIDNLANHGGVPTPAPTPSPATGTATVADGVITAPSSQPAVQFTEDVAFSGAIGTFSDPDVSSASTDFTATIDWDDGSTPTTGTISGSAGNFTVSGSHTYSRPNPSSYPTTLSIGVSIVDKGGSETGFSVTAQIASRLHFTFVTTTIQEGAPAGLIAHFTDANLSDTVASFVNIGDPNVCDVFWECGIGCDPTAIVVGGNGQFDIYSSQVNQSEEGAGSDCLGLDVEIDSLDGSEEDDAFKDISIVDATLSSTPKSIQVKPNVSWTGEIADFVDANQFASTNADYPTATIDWGDGSATSTGTVQRDGVTGVFSVIGTHTYTTPSPMPYTASVTVNDVGTATVTIKSSVLVLNSILKVTGSTNVVASAVASQLTVGSFTIDDLGSASTDFTATIDWGDGTTASAGTITGSRGEFLIAGNHTYATSGTFTTTLTVTDTRTGGGVAAGNGSSVVTNGLLTVDVPGSIVEYAGVAFNWTFSFNDAAAGATAAKYAISVDWGDKTTASKAAVVANAAGGFDASAGHTYAAVGDDTITVTITDATTMETLAMVTIKVSVVAQGADGGGTTGNGNSSSGSCSIGGVGGGRAATTGYGSALLLALMGLAFAFRRRRA